MTGGLIAALLFAVCWVIGLPRRPAAVRPKQTLVFKAFLPVKRQVLDPHEVPLFVHQLAGLLQAGRSPLQLWNDAQEAHGNIPDPVFSTLARPVLRSAHQAAVLGMSVPEVLRENASRTRHPGLRVLWQDLAACLEVSERSGAPLTVVLTRYAVQCESQLDSDAARQTALAGPKATVRLLSWLPIFGMGLAYLIGVDPLSVLLGSTAGVAALFAGLVLMAAGRIWSGKLVRTAAEEHS
ncbi:tight adherence protein B [Arthrobacter pigmenti]|uniref:Tight adherence protein B n=1 Tax=Arthrobacter pigmenti TaxID=271432 RepID=A0A846RPB4_9MICC|nr:tight adherence protein B [Arthrobacter pigmenti]